MPDRIELGPIERIVIRADPENPALYNLILSQPGGQKILKRASTEALRGLWSHLTSILYPHASDQLTRRIDTVRRQREDVPPDVAFTISTYANEADLLPIVVTGGSREQYWVIRLTRDVAEDLWTVIEDKLDQV